MNNLQKELIAEARHAVTNASAEIRLLARGKRTETQTLIILTKEILRAEACFKLLEKNGL